MTSFHFHFSGGSIRRQRNNIMLPLLPARALYIFLLAQQQHDSSTSTRPCFLDSSISSCASFLLGSTLHPSLATAAYDLDVSSSMTSSNDPLYLARPIGISSSSNMEMAVAMITPRKHVHRHQLNF